MSHGVINYGVNKTVEEIFSASGLEPSRPTIKQGKKSEK
jgi:hypothetical protein